MKERIFSKVNSKSNILKFKNQKDVNSIYPMLDEYGDSYKDYFIFKSTWDNKYYIEVDEQSTINDVFQKVDIINNNIE